MQSKEMTCTELMVASAGTFGSLPKCSMVGIQPLRADVLIQWVTHPLEGLVGVKVCRGRP